MSNASVGGFIQAMTSFKKSKLEERFQKFAEYVLDRSTHNMGWEEAEAQFGVGLEENNIEQIESTPINGTIIHLAGNHSDKLSLFIDQNGQENNEDQNFL